jgi:DNA-binding MarR family transcriptional regulator
MGVTAAAATQFIKRLEEFEYVQREVDALDRRVVKVSLTEKGKTAVTQTRACFAMALDGLVKDLGEEDAENLVRLLNKTSIYMEKEFLK